MGVGGRKADECQVLGEFGLYIAPTWNSCKGSQPSQSGRVDTCHSKALLTADTDILSDRNCQNKHKR